MTILQLQRRCEFVLFVLLLVGATTGLLAQTTGSGGLVSIRLEQKQGALVRTVSQNTVFHGGDILRFRLTSRIAGFLYVVDKGTTGTTATLFPGSGHAANNRIEPGQNYQSRRWGRMVEVSRPPASTSCTSW